MSAGDQTPGTVQPVTPPDPTATGGPTGTPDRTPTGTPEPMPAGTPEPSPTAAPPATTPSPSPARTPPPAPATQAESGSGRATPTAGPPAAATPPAWLGTRVLPLRPDGFGEIQPTPPELRDRRLVTVDVLPPPEGGDFVATVEPVPAEVADRSTWSVRCPVGLDELRYVTVSFWGFDHRPHTGELLVNTEVADDLVVVFRQLFQARFPIEQMRVTAAEELDAPPTGDGNNTTAFVCRATRGATSWSQHAYGLAVDVNPFQNPYAKGDVVAPELASAYTDRTWRRPGMLEAGDPVVKAFSAIGWGWGGTWESLTDWMHFSRNGR